jgi:hypothetical protein
MSSRGAGSERGVTLPERTGARHGYATVTRVSRKDGV